MHVQYTIKIISIHSSNKMQMQHFCILPNRSALIRHLSLFHIYRATKKKSTRFHIHIFLKICAQYNNVKHITDCFNYKHTTTTNWNFLKCSINRCEVKNGFIFSHSLAKWINFLIVLTTLILCANLMKCIFYIVFPLEVKTYKFDWDILIKIWFQKSRLGHN